MKKQPYQGYVPTHQCRLARREWTLLMLPLLLIACCRCCCALAGLCGGWYSTVLWIPEYFKARGAGDSSLYAESFAVAAANLPGVLMFWTAQMWRCLDIELMTTRCCPPFVTTGFSAAAAAGSQARRLSGTLLHVHTGTLLPTMPAPAYMGSKPGKQASQGRTDAQSTPSSRNIPYAALMCCTALL